MRETIVNKIYKQKIVAILDTNINLYEKTLGVLENQNKA